MSLTYSVMQTKLALQCNELQVNDPWYSYLGDAINEAGNGLILFSVSMSRQNMNLWPELRNRRWYDLTVNNQGYITKPDTMLVADALTCTRLTTAYDPSRHTEYPMREEPDQANFGLFSKDTTTVGWPTIWQDAVTQILVWPTPTTTYLTQVVMRGIRRESVLAGATDTFQMNAYWHPVVVDYATYLMKHRMGHDDADKWLGGVKERIGSTVDPLGLASRKNRTRVRIAGAA